MQVNHLANSFLLIQASDFEKVSYNWVLMKSSFFIHSLGCPKNSVDSQSMAELLVKQGYPMAENQQEAGIIIVNTCGFIQPARQEALDLLKEIMHEKSASQKVIAAGCLTQREKELVTTEVPGLDALIGTRRWMDILPVVRQLEIATNLPITSIAETKMDMEDKNILRATHVGGYAYLKIADGCDRGCAFCAIPLIKGAQVSRKNIDILWDVRVLQNEGVQELILIAQDVTTYGHDLGMKDGLPILLEEIIKTAPAIPWIRLLYTYPGEISQDLISLMAESPQMLPYLDIPLQHAVPEILRRMHRPSDMDKVAASIQSMRERIPNLAIRSTFIVGFPGETEREFQVLLDFIKSMCFDRVGIFPYSHERGTAAFEYSDDVTPLIKEERIQRLATLQEEISAQKNQEFVGKEMDVIVDGVGDDISVCRSYRDAPEIDGMVMVDGELEVGKITAVKITAALVHDLVASKID
jgi:ribosomal protein S12 methylthiotransferase